MLVLARELVRRGHRVTFVNQPDAQELIRDERIGFRAVGAASHPPGSLARRTASMGRLNGPFGMHGLIRDVASFTDMLCREAPQAIGEIGADAIVCDQMEAAGGLIAEYHRLSFASVATALPINREESVPPPYLSWAYDPTVRGRKRNRGGYRVSDWLMRPVGDVIEHHSRAFGLRPRRTAEECLSPLAQIAQCTRGLDFPREDLPKNFHYLGPFRESDGADLELPDEDGRPLAFCSFGTLQGGRAKLFRNVAHACEKQGLRLIIAHGGRLDPGVAEKLPGDPIVADYVSYAAVLRRASLVITHAGFNTVLDALAHAVPMIAIPLAFEQPATAARLVRVGVGRAIRPIAASSTRLQRELETILGASTYRERTLALQTELHASGGVRRAADILEATLA